MEDSSLLTTRVASTLSSLPFASRVSALVTPYLESHHVPERIANLERYARSQTETAVSSTKSAISTRTQPVLDALSSKYHQALDAKDSARRTVDAQLDKVRAAKESAVDAAKAKYASVQNAAVSTMTERVVPLAESVRDTSVGIASIAYSHVQVGAKFASNAAEAVTHGHTIAFAQQTASSVVNSVRSNSLLMKAEATIVGYGADIASVTLDFILPPELDEPLPLEEEDAEGHEAAQLGTATAAMVGTLSTLAARGKERVYKRSSRNYNALKTRTQHAIDQIQSHLPALPSFASRNLHHSSTQPSTSSPTTSSSPKSVTFAGFTITPVSRFATQSLSVVNDIDARVHRVVAAARARFESAAHAVVAVPSAAISSLHLKSRVLSAHTHAVELLDQHPSINSAISIVFNTIAQVAPQPLHNWAHQYTDWIAKASQESNNDAGDGMLADDELEDESDREVSVNASSGEQEEEGDLPAEVTESDQEEQETVADAEPNIDID